MPDRRATHAGSWYSDNSRELSKQLEQWLSTARSDGDNGHSPARAIIAPHAGYRYCGSCAGYAYAQINPSTTKRVFILGPSHHVRLNRCALSQASKYKTPIGDLIIDQEIYKDITSRDNKRLFERMSLETDEDEHSIEMHLPYIAKVMEGQNFTIVPILVGSISPKQEEDYGVFLSKYLADPDNVFVISSDFCHWGSRFRYQRYDHDSGKQIYEYIESLDRQGMDIIETIQPKDFNSYIDAYSNTICGRHPIGVLLYAAAHLKETKNVPMSLRFLNYAQSSSCVSMSDSSVSYAAASLIFDN